MIYLDLYEKISEVLLELGDVAIKVEKSLNEYLQLGSVVKQGHRGQQEVNKSSLVSHYYNEYYVLCEVPPSPRAHPKNNVHKARSRDVDMKG